jgi:hypothetical protein
VRWCGGEGEPTTRRAAWHKEERDAHAQQEKNLRQPSGRLRPQNASPRITHDSHSSPNEDRGGRTEEGRRRSWGRRGFKVPVICQHRDPHRHVDQERDDVPVRVRRDLLPGEAGSERSSFPIMPLICPHSFSISCHWFASTLSLRHVTGLRSLLRYIT